MNDMSRTIMSAVFAFLWLLTLGVVFFVASNAFGRADQYLKSQMVHDCSADYMSQTVNTETGRTVIRPLEQQVRECIYQKDTKQEWTGVWSKES